MQASARIYSVCIDHVDNFLSFSGGSGRRRVRNKFYFCCSKHSDRRRRRRGGFRHSHNELDGGWNNILEAGAPGYPVHRAVGRLLIVPLITGGRGAVAATSATVHNKGLKHGHCGKKLLKRAKKGVMSPSPWLRRRGSGAPGSYEKMLAL